MKCEETFCNLNRKGPSNEVPTYHCAGDKTDRRFCPRALRRKNAKLKRLIVEVADNTQNGSPWQEQKVFTDKLAAAAAGIKAGGGK